MQFAFSARHVTPLVCLVLDLPNAQPLARIDQNLKSLRLHVTDDAAPKPLPQHENRRHKQRPAPATLRRTHALSQPRPRAAPHSNTATLMVRSDQLVGLHPTCNQSAVFPPCRSSRLNNREPCHRSGNGLVRSLNAACTRKEIVSAWYGHLQCRKQPSDCSPDHRTAEAGRRNLRLSNQL